MAVHHTLAGGFQAGAGLPLCRLGEDGNGDPAPPGFSFSKAGKEREGVGVVVTAEECLLGEEGLWIPKGRTGEAGVG